MTSCYKWTYKNKETDSKVFSQIKEITGSEIIASLLINRGITCPKQAIKFLNPDNMEISSPSVFPDMEKAVNRIKEAISKQEKIIIYGDFDADGVTSTALLYKAFCFLGANAGYYIPDRTEEGHGLNKGAMCRLISQEQAKLIITVDCGISNPVEVKLAQSLGSDVIITDHHEIPEEIPEALAIINPKALDEDKTGLKYLAGVGVAYKLAVAVLEEYCKQDFSEELLHLVAVGTVGDVVPLLGENRAYVHKGLEIIARKKPASIAKILEISGNKPDKKISSSMIAFSIVPRINAIGRLAGANPAVEFLTSDDNLERIEELAEELNENNKERQQICETTFREAEAKIEAEIDLNRDKAIILADAGWHAGIVGIVASKLVEKYHRPALLIALDEEGREGRCSARSVDGLHLFETLSAYSDKFVQFGGHALAAGFVFNFDTISFHDLRKTLISYINEKVDFNSLKPEIKLDMNIEATDLTLDFIKELDRLAPYGEANPYPVFGIKNLTLKTYHPLGQKKNHLKLVLTGQGTDNLEAVWWNKTDLDVMPSDRVDTAFVPSINNFRNKDNIQLVLKDVKAVDDGSKAAAEEECSQEEPLFSDEELAIGSIFSTGEEKTDTQWIDHRQETGLKKDFLDYVLSLDDKLSVFAESPKAKKVLENIENLKPYVIDRTSLKQSDYLILLDIPSDDMTFMNVIKQTSPQEIHFFGLIEDIEPIELIKKISGMLKYAHNEKSGKINLDKTAMVLGLPTEIFLACVELLDAAQVVEIVEITEDSLNFNFKSSVNLNILQEQNEYRNLLDALQEFKEYKKDYKSKDIALIKETINNCCNLL